MRILVVEDDAVLRGVMQRSLADAGHRVDAAATVAEADHFWSVQPFDAVLLDLNLPQDASPASPLGSGLAVLRAARARGDRTPVLVATARDAVAERVQGLDAGADDYVLKPYELDELLARIRALARRAAGRAEPVYEHKGVS
ncbi:response regulator, partial [Myxococcus xanthus]